MKILVTGSDGFFGSWLADGLTALGHEIDGYDLTRGDDVQDVAALRKRIASCEAVLHLAAYSHFQEDVPAQNFFQRNVIGTAHVVQAMQRARIRRLVYASSGAIYGFGPNRPLEGWATPPINEAQYPALADWERMDAYSGSKLACEEWLQAVPRMAITALRINCIEPHHGGAKDLGHHWGWWCS